MEGSRRSLPGLQQQSGGEGRRAEPRLHASGRSAGRVHRPGWRVTFTFVGKDAGAVDDEDDH
jgi:hypothetical protein